MFIQGHFFQTYTDLLASQADGGLMNYFLLPNVVTYCIDKTSHINTHTIYTHGPPANIQIHKHTSNPMY